MSGSATTVKPAIATPCIKVCMVDGESGLCLGCFRTLSEIARWAGMSENDRAATVTELPSRRARIRPDKLGLI